MGVPSRSGDPREHNWDRPPTHSHRTLDLRSPDLPRPACAPGAFPAAVATTESTTGKPSPTPARSRPQPRPDPAPRRPGSPRPCRAPGAFPAAVRRSEAHV